MYNVGWKSACDGQPLQLDIVVLKNSSNDFFGFFT